MEIARLMRKRLSACHLRKELPIKRERWKVCPATKAARRKNEPVMCSGAGSIPACMTPVRPCGSRKNSRSKNLILPAEPTRR